MDVTCPHCDPQEEINKVIKHSLVLKDTNMSEEYLMDKLANKASVPKPCYDMSIHSNPNAAAWAKEFMKTKHERKLSISDIDEGLMLAWFANAMMAMHDHLVSQHEKQKEWNGLGIPPEGIECEVSNCGGNYEWCRIKYTGESLCVVDHLHTTEQHYHLRSVNFRKIQSEREKWCDSVRKTSNIAFDDGQLDVVYDGLLDGKIPVPTLEK